MPEVLLPPFVPITSIAYDHVRSYFHIFAIGHLRRVLPQKFLTTSLIAFFIQAIEFYAGLNNILPKLQYM